MLPTKHDRSGIWICWDYKSRGHRRLLGSRDSIWPCFGTAIYCVEVTPPHCNETTKILKKNVFLRVYEDRALLCIRFSNCSLSFSRHDINSREMSAVRYCLLLIVSAVTLQAMPQVCVDPCCHGEHCLFIPRLSLSSLRSVKEWGAFFFARAEWWQIHW